MFSFAPSKQSQSDLRYWARNRYKAHVNGVRWSNRAYTDAPPTNYRTQIRLRHVLMTEDQKASVIRLTGSSPFIEKTFVPVPRGRSRTQVGRKEK